MKFQVCEVIETRIFGELGDFERETVYDITVCDNWNEMIECVQNYYKDLVDRMDFTDNISLTIQDKFFRIEGEYPELHLRIVPQNVVEFFEENDIDLCKFEGETFFSFWGHDMYEDNDMIDVEKHIKERIMKKHEFVLNN